jgi:hypothetical protein
MGIILASNGVVGALATQILTPIIYGTSDGWRTSYRTVSIMMLCIGVLVVLFLRNEPKDVGAEALGSGSFTKKKRGRDWSGISSQEAFRKPYFYICMTCVFLTGMLLQSATGVASAHMMDRGISAEAMAQEVKKEVQRRIYRQKKKQERHDLAPAANMQPNQKGMRYENVRSAAAEEGVLRLVLLEPLLLDQIPDLTGSEFSAPLLGKVFDQMCVRYRQGLEVSLGVLEDLTQEEMSHIAAIHQRQQGPASEAAFKDCIKTIHSVRQAAKVTSDDDLLAFQNKLRESKGTNK